MDFLRVLAMTSGVSISVPLVVASIRLRNGGPFVRVLFVYALIIAFVEAGGIYTSSRNINNVWMSHLYVPLEYMLLSLGLSLGFSDKRIKQGIYASIVLVLLFSVANAMFWQPLDQMNSYPRAISSTLMSLQALLYLYKAFMDVTNVKLLKDSFFLLCVGILIYFVGTVFFFAFLEDMIRQSREMARGFMIINSICTITFNLILAVVIWRAPQR